MGCPGAASGRRQSELWTACTPAMGCSDTTPRSPPLPSNKAILLSEAPTPCTPATHKATWWSSVGGRQRTYAKLPSCPQPALQPDFNCHASAASNARTLTIGQQPAQEGLQGRLLRGCRVRRLWRRRRSAGDGRAAERPLLASAGPRATLSRHRRPVGCWARQGGRAKSGQGAWRCGRAPGAADDAHCGRRI